MGQKLSFSDLCICLEYVDKYIVPSVIILLKFYKRYPRNFWIASLNNSEEIKQLRRYRTVVKKLWKHRPIFDYGNPRRTI